MENIILIIHLIVAVLLIGAILLQRSEGGALGIGGSGGGGGNLFSARGVGNGLTRGTAILAVCFFATSIALTMIAVRKGPSNSAFDNVPAATGEAAPAKPDAEKSVLPNLQPPKPETPQAPVSN
jgi:preprotein translocase subunit SecG